MLFWSDQKIIQDAAAETKISLVTIIHYANISLKIGYSIMIHDSDYLARVII